MKTIVISFIFLAMNMVQLRAMSLEDFNQRFEEELGKISAQRTQQQEALNVKYLGALLRLETQAKNQGNLELLQSVRSEISRIEQNEDLPEFGAPPPAELADMQKVMNDLHKKYKKEEAESVVKLVESLKGYAGSRVTEATRQNNISEAMAWKNWEESLSENQMVEQAYARSAQKNSARSSGQKPAKKFHASLKGKPTTIIAENTMDYSESPRAFKPGAEPKGKEKRIRSSTPSMQGAGHTKLTGTVILIEEKDISKSGYNNNYKEKSFVYVPRLTISPLIGQELDRCLVVFDLFKRGTGSKRSIIRTDQILLPPLGTNERVVVDAGLYEYETTEYDSSWSTYDYKSATADEFYGYIVTIFDKDGELIFQRCTERILDEFARETPPSD